MEDCEANGDQMKQENVVKKTEKGDLLYTVSQSPPIHITAILSFQQVLISLAASLAVSSYVAEAVCADWNADLKAKLLSSTLFMNGVTTLLMITVGIRLPLYQGAASLYIIPLIAIQSVESNRCQNLDNTESTVMNNRTILRNTTYNMGTQYSTDLILTKIREMAGSLMVAGVVHCAIGATGLVGVALRFIGPVTIVPTVLMTGLYLSRAVAKFCRPHWGIALATAAMAIILSIYLSKRRTPLPYWSHEKGFHWTTYPLHQIFAILFGILFGWALSAIFTATDVLPNDPTHVQFKARTDTRGEVIENAQWFYFPYPGQFGMPTFDSGVFSAFLIATFISILDSIGDYYACAVISNVPPPPVHGVNRGIMIEGFCTALSGAMGCGHATSTQGGNIGAIGITKVASRSVFLGTAFIFILFGIVGKVSAIFVTMPYPVLGGAMLVMYGMFTGVILSNLNVVSLKSTRNLGIIGISIISGLAIPRWIETTPGAIDTGIVTTDRILKLLLANPNLIAGVLSCLLDNTTPGTLEERGITAWRPKDSAKDTKATLIKDRITYSEGIDIYNLSFTTKCVPKRIRRFLPFLPQESHNEEVLPQPLFSV